MFWLCVTKQRAPSDFVIVLTRSSGCLGVIRAVSEAILYQFSYLCTSWVLTHQGHCTPKNSHWKWTPRSPLPLPKYIWCQIDFNGIENTLITVKHLVFTLYVLGLISFPEMLTIWSIFQLLQKHKQKCWLY